MIVCQSRDLNPKKADFMMDSLGMKCFDVVCATVMFDFVAAFPPGVSADLLAALPRSSSYSILVT